jgi:hypothetical protein
MSCGRNQVSDDRSFEVGVRNCGLLLAGDDPIIMEIKICLSNMQADVLRTMARAPEKNPSLF